LPITKHHLNSWKGVKKITEAKKEIKKKLMASESNSFVPSKSSVIL
jgi:hypothetical protein